VRPDSLEEVYSAKSDDELLALAEEQASLREEAKQVLADELQRRNLNGYAAIPSFTEPAESTTFKKALPRAKWLGLWLVTTLIATLGTTINVGIITYSLRSFVSREARIHFAETLVYGPYYPLPVLIGVLIGFFSYLRFRGTYRYWVWIVPALYVLTELLDWKESNHASLADSIVHFFGTLAYPANREQLGSTMFLYMAIAYVVGALIHSSLKERWSAVIRLLQRELS
jgi:hypothetical protein